MTSDTREQSTKVRFFSSIRFQLVLGFAVILFLMGTIIYETNATLNTLQAQFRDIVEVSLQVTELSRAMQNEYLLARQAESDFLDSWQDIGVAEAKLRYSVANQRHIGQARIHMSQLRVLAESSEGAAFDDIETQVGEIRPLFGAYEQAFLATVANIEELGQADGLFKEMERTLDSMQQLAKTAVDPELQQLIFQLKNNELAYLNGGEQQYIDSARLLTDKLNALVENSDLSAADQEDMLALSEQYSNLFDTMVGLQRDVEINKIIFQEVSEDIGAQIQFITEDASIGLDEARLGVDNYVSSALFAATLSGLVVIVLGLIIAFILSRRIIGSLSLLTEAAQKVERGSLNQSVPIRRRDEFGVLASVFNGMVGQISGLVGSLERRVAARTRDLELAAEVGQGLTAVRDLNVLLTDAVENIRSRFDLYYVQIYLVDAADKNLILHAGTGSAGQMLLQRAHRLPLDGDSINSDAVLRKTAVIVEDTATSPVFYPNALLPRTRSELAIPMLVAGRVVGVLDMQSELPRAFSAENLPAYELLAGQLAIAVDNAKLFAEINVAQQKMEAQTQRLSQEAWNAYLDAIHHEEWTGYSYDLRETAPLTEPLAQSEMSMSVPIDVVGEVVGSIQLERPTGGNWSEDDQEMATAVARQVAQQIENLRLLSEAERYRVEMEDAARRLVREGWDDFQQRDKNRVANYIYDQRQVEGATDAAPISGGVSQSLVISGETIGVLEVDGADTENADTAVLLQRVAAQLSSHIEALRLGEQTEIALADAQRRSRQMSLLNEIVSKVATTLDIEKSLQIIVKELTQALNVDLCDATLINEDRSALIVIAEYAVRPDTPSAKGQVIPIAGNLLTEQVLQTKEYIYVEDAQHDPLTESTWESFRQQNIESVAVFPMLLGDEVIGTVGVSIREKEITITKEQLQLAETIIRQAATTVQNARLFERTQEALEESRRRSQEMETVNVVAQIASQQLGFEQLLQAVYEQIRGLMDAGTFHIALYNREKNMMEYPMIYEKGVRTRQDPLPVNPTSYTYRVIQTGEPLMENLDPEEVEATLNSNIFIGESENKVTVSLLYAPMRVGQQVIGALSVQSYNYNAYNEADMSLLTSIANYVAVALENSRLFEQTRERARREHILREVTAQVHTAVDAESILRTAAAELNRALGLETFVYLDPPSGSPAAAVPEANGEQADV